VLSSFNLLQSGFGSGKYQLRGGIGWGDLETDGKFILVGSALEDAHLCEQQQVWSGAMLSCNCVSFVKTKNYLERFCNLASELPSGNLTRHQRESLCENSKILKSYDIPIKHRVGNDQKYSSIDGVVIDWTIRMYDGASTKFFLTPTDDHQRKIQTNTQEFEAWARQFKV
jgi:hypothetical protein